MAQETVRRLSQEFHQYIKDFPNFFEIKVGKILVLFYFLILQCTMPAKKASVNADQKLFAELFENSPEIKYPKEGEVISGTIEKIEKKNILVNVNNQFTGLVISKELGNSVNIDSLVSGQPIDVMVLGDSVERGLLILSLKRANQIKSLNALNSNFASGQVMTVRPTEANK